MNVVEKVIFQIPERFGEIHINLLRIYQTPGFIPERIQLVPAECLQSGESTV